MIEQTQMAIIISVGIYKLACLATGTLLVYMGYRLFMASIWGKAGEVDLQFKENKLLIRKAAPGTFFTVAGTIVLVVTLSKGLGFEIQQAQRIEPPIEKPSLPDMPATT